MSCIIAAESLVLRFLYQDMGLWGFLTGGYRGFRMPDTQCGVDRGRYIAS